MTTLVLVFIFNRLSFAVSGIGAREKDSKFVGRIFLNLGVKGFLTRGKKFVIDSTIED